MRLFAFGDSTTYGYGLDDVWPEPRPQSLITAPQWNPYKSHASAMAWPQILADLLEYECFNFGSSGSGNKEILWRIQRVAADIQPQDIVIVFWSFFNRFCILEDHMEETWDVAPNRMGMGFNRDYSKEKIWDRIADPYDLCIDNWQKIHYADLVMKSRELDIHHMFYMYDSDINNFSPDFIDVSDLSVLNLQEMTDSQGSGFSDIESAYPRANDGMHLGPQGHVALAEKLYEVLKSNV